jgi:hypothetical protein
MGLALPLALLVAFRAGRLRGLNDGNMEERLSDLAFDTVKERICTQLSNLFETDFHNYGQHFHLPHGLTIQQVAAHIHFDNDNLELLQDVYMNLVNQGMQSHDFIDALQYVLTFSG